MLLRALSFLVYMLSLPTRNLEHSDTNDYDTAPKHSDKRMSERTPLCGQAKEKPQSSASAIPN